MSISTLQIPHEIVFCEVFILICSIPYNPNMKVNTFSAVDQPKEPWMVLPVKWVEILRKVSKLIALIVFFSLTAAESDSISEQKSLRQSIALLLMQFYNICVISLTHPGYKEVLRLYTHTNNRLYLLIYRILNLPHVYVLKCDKLRAMLL